MKLPLTEQLARWSQKRVVLPLAVLASATVLSVLAGWIKFHGIDFWWTLTSKHEEIAFDVVFALSCALLVAAIIGILLIALHFWRVSKNQLDEQASRLEPKDLLTLRNDLRASRFQAISTIAQIGGGVALLVGIYLTYANLNETRDSQITDRFIRAVDQLGAADSHGGPEPEIRLGGVYGLIRIAQHSRQDYGPVRKILNDYIQINAPWTGRIVRSSTATTTPSATAVSEVHPKADVQAAFEFLGRPIKRYEGPVSFQLATLLQVDLRETDLGGAILIGGDLESALLPQAHLEGAVLIDTTLKGAILTGAYLEETNLASADLRGANLAEAHLDGATLAGADLRGANLADAHLDGATLFLARMDHSTILTHADLRCANIGTDIYSSGVDLSSVLNLTRWQIDSLLQVTKDVKLPSHFGDYPKKSCKNLAQSQ